MPCQIRFREAVTTIASHVLAAFGHRAFGKGRLANLKKFQRELTLFPKRGADEVPPAVNSVMFMVVLLLFNLSPTPFPQLAYELLSANRCLTSIIDEEVNHDELRFLTMRI